MPYINDGATDLDRSAATGCGSDDRKDNTCDTHVPQDKTSHGRVCVPESHCHAQPRYMSHAKSLVHSDSTCELCAFSAVNRSEG